MRVSAFRTRNEQPFKQQTSYSKKPTINSPNFLQATRLGKKQFIRRIVAQNNDDLRIVEPTSGSRKVLGNRTDTLQLEPSFVSINS